MPFNFNPSKFARVILTLAMLTVSGGTQTLADEPHAPFDDYLRYRTVIENANSYSDVEPFVMDSRKEALKKLLWLPQHNMTLAMSKICLDLTNPVLVDSKVTGDHATLTIEGQTSDKYAMQYAKLIGGTATAKFIPTKRRQLSP